MSERETKTNSRTACPECGCLPTLVVECESYDDTLETWQVDGEYRKCPRCNFSWGGVSFLHCDPAEYM